MGRSVLRPYEFCVAGAVKIRLGAVQNYLGLPLVAANETHL
jgi:hypothetical protein